MNKIGFAKSLLNFQLEFLDFRIINYHEVTINSFKFLIMRTWYLRYMVAMWMS